MKKRFYLLLAILSILAPVSVRLGYVLPKQSIVLQEKTYEAGSIGCYIINLDRSTGRMNAMSVLLTQLHLPFHRIAAIDGKQHPEILQDSKLINLEGYADLLKGNIPGSGEAACYLSHVKALETFLESSYEFGFIFEDDVSFSPSELQKLLPLLVDKKELWDICSLQLLAYHPGWDLKIAPLHEYALCLYRRPFWCAGAYLVNRAAAQSLVQKAFPMKMPWDLYYLRFWEFKGQNERMLRFTGIEPSLVRQTYGDSEIENSDSRHKTHTQAPYGSWTYIKGRLFDWATNIWQCFWVYWIYIWIYLGTR
ncbi:MAG: hypothetical protein BGO07_03150 [Alphaproteobacteria bacterium 40-19]|nr:MAG: hypothetical protein BGO07_03150 [Alphaproteobacteria bacterium 40-19]